MKLKHLIHTLSATLIFVLMMSCQPITEKDLAGNWRPELRGLEAKIGAKIDEKMAEASNLEKIGLGVSKGMIPKIIKSLEEMRLVLNADSSYSMSIPKLMGKKNIAKNGKWQLSEDKTKIILNLGLGEEQSIKIIDATTIVLETKEDAKNPLTEITLKKEE